ncbi:LLM class flavin-dependent oxidoreductase [Streptomyces caatingaensis]|uniref:Luciferase-like domain-containing protein n=1 Tax=Streptomyces caatingaensis TaxID=1678637 RepID=A0A0K9XAF4_9ACTN|nr:LLM class flavin-dependent oxidoreductase [Streptomyces caatingaensis]KNB49637.1 hypothetical protein AC230_22825 [Streptomyces caatingaensis]
MPAPIRPLHLAVALGRRDARVQEAESCVRAARLAEHGRFDFVTLGDASGPPAEGRGRPDALAVLARIAPATRRVGLVPALTATTRTGPFPLARAVAGLDRASRGRAGWVVEPPLPTAGARASGRRAAPAEEEAWREADAVADAVARLWDGHDRDRPHRAGPSAGPRSPQGRPVTVVDATAPAARATAARHADVVLLRAERAHDPAVFRARSDDLREAARAHGPGAGGRRPLVLASVPVDLHTAADAVGLADQVHHWYATGAADGFHFRPGNPDRDLPLLADGTAAVLQHRGLLRRFYPGATLREHLELPRPATGRAPARGTA